MLYQIGFDEFMRKINQNKSEYPERFKWKFPKESTLTYMKAKLFSTEYGSIFGISHNNEIISFIPKIGDKTVPAELIKYAVALGGESIEVYESFVTTFNIYGFTDVDKITEWNNKNIPDGWNEKYEKEKLFTLSIPQRKIQEIIREQSENVVNIKENKNKYTHQKENEEIDR